MLAADKTEIVGHVKLSGAEEQRSGFRADIEGLRALAILLVVAVHAQVPGVRGGFIGVDVFFVISGYLITGLLAAEITRTGKVDFVRFYARRIRRLLPAVFTMTLVTLAAGAAILSPLEFVRLGKSAIATASYVSNAWFLLNSVDYFSPDLSAYPLIHTWSLAVEEQFYFVWPLLMFLCLRRRRSARDLIMPFCGVFLLSLVAGVWFTRTHQQVAFYSSPTRAWEFDAGGMATLVSGEKLRRALGHPVMGWIGGAMIVGTGFWLSPDYPFPGIVALIPVIGTVLVLIAGAVNSGKGFSAVIQHRFFRKIGVLSYSWYLWHWPILVFGRLLIPARSEWVSIGLALLSLGFAWVSYVVIESPIRFNPKLMRSSGLSLGLGAGLTLAGVAAAVLCTGLAQRSMRSSEQLPIAQASVPNGAEPCMTGFAHSQPKVCSFGAGSAAKTLVLFGDSHAAQWLPAANRAAANHGWRVVTLFKASCPSVTVPVYNPRLEREETECAAWRKEALAYVARLKPSLVVVTNSSGYVRFKAGQDGYARLSFRQWEDGLRTTLEALRGSGAKAVVLRDTPRTDIDVPVCLSRAKSHPRLYPMSACFASEQSTLATPVWAGETAVAQSIDQVYPVDLTSSFCSSGVCPPEKNGLVVYRDGNHISGGFATALAPVLAEQLSRIMDSGPSPAIVPAAMGR